MFWGQLLWCILNKSKFPPEQGLGNFFGYLPRIILRKMKLWYPTIIQELQQIMPNINSWTNILEKFYLKQDSL